MVSFADPADTNGSAMASTGGVTVVVGLAAAGSNPVLNGNGSGVGVNSDLDAGSTVEQRRVDGTLAVPESVTMTFSGFTESLPLNGFLLGSLGDNETVTFQSLAFDGATGYDSNGFSFDEGTDTISYNKTAGSGLTDLDFPGSTILITAGDEIVFSTSLAVEGGVLLDAVHLEVPVFELSTRILSSFPTNGLVNNGGNGASSITSVAAANRKGQSFSLPVESAVTGFVFQLDDAMASPDVEGSFELEVIPALNDLPWLESVHNRAGIYPAGLTTGDVFEVVLATPLQLPRGAYAVTLASEDGEVRLKLSGSDAYLQGSVIRNNAASGNRWALGIAEDLDMVFAVLGTETGLNPSTNSGPNVVMILADDLGWTDIRAEGTGPNVLGGTNYGSDFYQTPNIARLAAEGLSFTRCYMQPNCAPTRAALLSGQYSARSGNGVYVVNNLNRGDGGEAFTPPGQREDIPASSVTYAEQLQVAGYVTAHFGKYHVGGKDGGQSTLPLQQGFDLNFGGQASGSPGSYRADGTQFGGSIGPEMDRWAANYDQTYIDEVLKGPAGNPLHLRAADPNAPDDIVGDNKHVTDAVGDAFVAFADNHRAGALAGQPFFAQVHTYAVHTPIQARTDLQDKYIPLPDGTFHQANAYAALVEGLDQTVGRVLDYLDDPNGDGDFSDSIASNTVVIFTSDNGGHEGSTDNAPLRNRKGSFYDGGTRVPLIVRQPGAVPAGVSSDTLVHAVDFYPTLLAFAQGAAPDVMTHKLDGVSFAAHALNPEATQRARAPIFYHFPGYLDNRARPCSVCIKRIDGRDYKIIYNYDFTYQGNNPRDDAMPLLTQPWELYALNEDLSETTNLIGDSYSDWLLYGAIADEMAADLRAWLTQPGSDWQPVQVSDNGMPIEFPPAAVPDVVGEAFRIVEKGVDIATGSRTLSWQSEDGFSYEIQGSDDLENWSVLASDIQASSTETGMTTISAEVLNDAHHYYRVRLYRAF